MCEPASFFTAGSGLVNHSRCDCVQVQKRDGGVGGCGGCRKCRDARDIINSEFNLANLAVSPPLFVPVQKKKCVG